MRISMRAREFKKMKPRELKQKITKIIEAVNISDPLITIDVTAPTSLGEKLPLIKKVLMIEWKEIAEILGVSPRTLQRWRRDETTPKEKTDKLEKIYNICTILLAAYPTERLRKYFLHSPESSLSSCSPLDALKKGKIDEVYQLLLVIAEGTYA